MGRQLLIYHNVHSQMQFYKQLGDATLKSSLKVGEATLN